MAPQFYYVVRCFSLPEFHVTIKFFYLSLLGLFLVVKMRRDEKLERLSNRRFESKASVIERTTDQRINNITLIGMLEFEHCLKPT